MVLSGFLGIGCHSGVFVRGGFFNAKIISQGSVVRGQGSGRKFEEKSKIKIVGLASPMESLRTNRRM